MGGFECGADVAVKGAHEDRICSFSAVFEHRDGPAGRGRSITSSEKGVLARALRGTVAPESPGDDRGRVASAVRKVAESCEIPAVVGSDG